jgi:hypothetical protein
MTSQVLGVSTSRYSNQPTFFSLFFFLLQKLEKEKRKKFCLRFRDENFEILPFSSVFDCESNTGGRKDRDRV